MVNVTVIKLKDILKYIIKILVAIILLFSFQKVAKKTSRIKEIRFAKIIEQNIPILKKINVKEEQLEEKIEKINPLNIIASNELKITNHIKPKEQQENLNEKKEEEQQEIKKNQNVAIEQAQTGLATEVLPSNVPNKYTNSYHNVQIRNETEYVLTEEMLIPDITVNNKNVLIFHTHTCESYTASEKYNYEQTGTYRTTDLNYSVARVGTELTNQLTSYGYNLIHNTTYHDFPAYSGSYGRSLETVENILKENKDIDVVLDIHRDAIGDYSYAPTVRIGKEEAAQLMFVIGTDGGGLEHPNWNQNLKFAIKLQEKANEMYPRVI